MPAAALETESVDHQALLNKDSKITNFNILLVTSILFGGFVIAEIIGALVSCLSVLPCACLC